MITNQQIPIQNKMDMLRNYIHLKQDGGSKQRHVFKRILTLKDIFACLFSIHNIISLSCHEQV